MRNEGVEVAHAEVRRNLCRFDEEKYDPAVKRLGHIEPETVFSNPIATQPSPSTRRASYEHMLDNDIVKELKCPSYCLHLSTVQPSGATKQ